MSFKSKSRQGLERLLDLNPTAEIAEVWNQDGRIQEVERTERGWIRNLNRESEPLSELSGSRVGPWMCVDLVTDSKLHRYAIWLTTGNVYRLDEMGAVEEDPFIIITTIREGQ